MSMPDETIATVATDDITPSAPDHPAESGSATPSFTQIMDGAVDVFLGVVQLCIGGGLLISGARKLGTYPRG